MGVLCKKRGHVVKDMHQFADSVLGAAEPETSADVTWACEVPVMGYWNLISLHHATWSQVCAYLDACAPQAHERLCGSSALQLLLVCVRL